MGRLGVQVRLREHLQGHGKEAQERQHQVLWMPLQGLGQGEGPCEAGRRRGGILSCRIQASLSRSRRLHKHRSERGIMNKYQFVSANGIDIEISVEGSYHDRDDKDLYVIASNGFEQEFEECGDGEDVIEALEANGVEFDYYPRHFNAYVINACMIAGDDTTEGALEYQAKWESENPMKVKDANGNWIDYEAAENMMDDGLRESLHGEMAPCRAQEFIEAYAKAHAEEFGGEKWAPYYGGAW